MFLTLRRQNFQVVEGSVTRTNSQWLKELSRTWRSVVNYVEYSCTHLVLLEPLLVNKHLHRTLKSLSCYGRNQSGTTRNECHLRVIYKRLNLNLTFLNDSNLPLLKSVDTRLDDSFVPKRHTYVSVYMFVSTGLKGTLRSSFPENFFSSPHPLKCPKGLYCEDTKWGIHVRISLRPLLSHHKITL